MVLHARCADGIREDLVINESWTIEYEPRLHARITKITERLCIVNGVFFFGRFSDLVFTCDIVKQFRDIVCEFKKNSRYFQNASNGFALGIKVESGVVYFLGVVDLNAAYIREDYLVLWGLLREHRDWPGFSEDRIASFWG